VKVVGAVPVTKAAAGGVSGGDGKANQIPVGEGILLGRTADGNAAIGP